MVPFAAFCFAVLTMLGSAGSTFGGDLLAQSDPANNSDATAGDAVIRELRGATMGTTYMVKIYDPPEFESDVAIAVDAELRAVNDQMSTYLKSSEISRFNDSDSTDWFDVSVETAEVVSAALEIAEATGGAFDVTVGPLVNAWSFGPDPKTNVVPSDSVIDTLRESVGYKKLAVRMDPPALKKSVPTLKVDLSSIAKGHGVDRVVDRLADLGAENVFVEIGGEVRVAGSKGGQPWKVGIQNPQAANADGDAMSLAAAHPMQDQAMATSGDYRIYFEVDGKRYSHTIDPRTGRPIDHDLASVSVVADTCMKADGWATAINVLGADAGIKVASEQGLDVLVIRRRGDEFVRVGTGSLSSYALAAAGPATADVDPTTDVAADQPPSLYTRMLPTLVITVIGFGVILFAMAIGVIFGRKSISGSCGGLAGKKNDDGSVSCSLCSNPSDACQELREQMKEGRAKKDAAES
ncbi:hypothetical protein Rcae01_02206 [Novipirellula caenicola]|uniref:FAD:protein FMN transferase n=2 Tax=Novipirellula caenicola TaxID=1536901 RepID=A0ABP9VTC6_9BACT